MISRDRLVALILTVCAAGACSESAPTEPTSAGVASYMPVPPAPLAVGFTPPNYVGLWVGTSTQTGCSSSVAGFCRIVVAPRQITIRISQTDGQVSGTISGETFTGYIAADLGIFGRTNDGGFRLDRIGDEFSGIEVDDSLDNNSVLIRSNLYELRSLRKVD